MNRDDALRALLSKLLDWEDAHASFDTGVEGIPADSRGRRPEGSPHSPWQLLEHLRICQNDILDFCRNPGYVERKFEDYWPRTAVPPSAGAWDESVAAFRRGGAAQQQRGLLAVPQCGGGPLDGGSFDRPGRNARQRLGGRAGRVPGAIGGQHQGRDLSLPRRSDRAPPMRPGQKACPYRPRRPPPRRWLHHRG